MKRKIALFMVLAMLISLVPMNVFASSSASINKSFTVGKDQNWAINNTSAPVLKIKEADEDFATDTHTFQLTLVNGKWNDALVDESNITISGTGLTFGAYNVERLSDTKLSIELPIATNNAATDGIVNIPMYVNVGDAGKVEVKITPIDAAFDAETVTVATVVSGDTSFEVDEVATIGSAATDINTLVIEELAAGTIAATPSQIKIKLLDSDFQWVAHNENAGSTEINFSGGFTQADLESSGYTIATGDEHILVLPAITALSTSKGIISLSGLKVKPTKDASYGEVKAKIYGADVTEQTIVIGNYSDYGMTVEAADEAADLPVIYAGTKTEEVSNLIIEETVPDSWLTDRTTSITFPEWVKVVSVSAADSDNITFPGTWYTIDDNVIDLDGLVVASGEKAMLELQIVVSVEANASGDITAEVGGRGIDNEMKVKLADGKLPFTTTFEVSDVKIGLQEQKIGKITVTEAEDAVLEDGAIIMFDMDGLNFDDEGVVKTVKGDIEMNDPEVNNGNLEIEVDNDSSEASTFEITGVTVTLDRDIPEGKFYVKVKDKTNSKFIENYNSAGTDPNFDTDYLQKLVAVNVITPAPGDTKAGEKVVFTIGSADYMVGANKVTSDVAPYINEQGRTMLPLRALANALGVTDANIMWNEVERSVTIFKGDATIKVVVGQMSFVKNGVAVPMDTMAVINNSRTMLPLRAIGQALGAVVTWDEATRTVTIN